MSTMDDGYVVSSVFGPVDKLLNVFIFLCVFSLLFLVVPLALHWSSSAVFISKTETTKETKRGKTVINKTSSTDESALENPTRYEDMKKWWPHTNTTVVAKFAFPTCIFLVVVKILLPHWPGVSLPEWPVCVYGADDVTKMIQTATKHEVMQYEDNHMHLIKHLVTKLAPRLMDSYYRGRILASSDIQDTFRDALIANSAACHTRNMWWWLSVGLVVGVVLYTYFYYRPDHWDVVCKADHPKVGAYLDHLNMVYNAMAWVRGIPSRTKDRFWGGRASKEEPERLSLDAIQAMNLGPMRKYFHSFGKPQPLYHNFTKTQCVLNAITQLKLYK